MTDLLPTPTTGLLAPAARVPVAPQRLSALDDLVRGFLLSKRSPKTREAYAADLASWLAFCSGLGVDPLAAGIHHADAYLRLCAESGDPRSGRRLRFPRDRGGISYKRGGISYKNASHNWAGAWRGRGLM